MWFVRISLLSERFCIDFSSIGLIRGNEELDWGIYGFKEFNEWFVRNKGVKKINFKFVMKKNVSIYIMDEFNMMIE